MKEVESEVRKEHLNKTASKVTNETIKVTKEQNKKAREIDELLKKTELEVREEMKSNIQKDKIAKEQAAKEAFAKEEAAKNKT